MRQIVLHLSDEEYELLDDFRTGRHRTFHDEYGDQVLAIDDGGGLCFCTCESFTESSALIAAAFNGLFQAMEDQAS